MTDLDLLYTDVETDLRDSLRRLLADRCPPAAVAAAYEGDRSLSGSLWKALSQEMGLAGLLVPVERGGAGASAREAAVVLEELGRAVAPMAFLTSSVIATTALPKTPAGGPASDLLAALASGEAVAAPAVSLAAAGGDVPALRLDPAGRVSRRVRSVAGALDAGVFLVPVGAADGMAIACVASGDAAVAPVTSLDIRSGNQNLHPERVHAQLERSSFPLGWPAPGE